MNSWPARAGLIATSIAFIGLALPFMRHLGIEADEAMVANGIFAHGQPWYSWRFGQFEVPVMLISYLGALKTWLLNPYFALWHPSPISLRLPAVLAGVLTVWLFFALLDRIAGRRAAWIGALLLATDSAFLLIETTDFGFVALQFVLKLTGILLLLRFDRSGRLPVLAAGFFLFGVALWDKAVFVWVLCGLAAATAIVFPRALWRNVTLRNVGIATASLSVGALPLVIYNIERPLETWRANVRVLREPVLTKADILFRTIDGSALFGFVTATEPGVRPGPSWHTIQSLSMSRNVTLPAVAAAVIATLIFWRKKTGHPVLFGLIACSVTWLLMAMTAGAGGSVQHTILLWPFHLMIIAIAVEQLSARWAVPATAILCAFNLAVTNRYYTDLITNGPAIRWSDATEPLERYLTNSGAKRIFVADWGIIETLSLLSEGSLPVYSADVQDPAMFDRIIESPDQIFVSHTPGFTFDPGIRTRLEDRAWTIGRVPVRVAVIPDSNGRSTFEVFRFEAGH
jgi:4-amino-4-deoxy-L-arabinose transferase-like glycosyltransferase